ncbi:MAG TPA: NusA-like transcription termination signal-binding factor [Euryarchaeota archaeon]|nr:transcription elongation factor NusA-like protein [archaeon BMS3Bbin15]HDL16038.1 NusA-like transcription termination signal-binding factor [Euryarchaeota archaeon]
METLRLSANEISYIALFESNTGAVTRDCIVDDSEGKIIFVVKKGDMGIAIGKKGVNVARVRQTLGKKVEIIEHGETPEEFVKNILNTYRVKDVEVEDNNGKKIVKVKVDPRDKNQVIGRKGKNLEKVKMLLSRHHGIDDVIII